MPATIGAAVLLAPLAWAALGLLSYGTYYSAELTFAADSLASDSRYVVLQLVSLAAVLLVAVVAAVAARLPLAGVVTAVALSLPGLVLALVPSTWRLLGIGGRLELTWLWTNSTPVLLGGALFGLSLGALGRVRPRGRATQGWAWLSGLAAAVLAPVGLLLFGIGASRLRYAYVVTLQGADPVGLVVMFLGVVLVIVAVAVAARWVPWVLLVTGVGLSAVQLVFSFGREVVWSAMDALPPPARRTVFELTSSNLPGLLAAVFLSGAAVLLLRRRGLDRASSSQLAAR